ncbi:MAG: proline dehydrogenase family protein [Acidimicrobiia bacterium]|nr:proline dehydrogenase family protein [Acidimicrobiia bacterium]
MNILGRGLLAVTNRSFVRNVITGTRPGRALSTRFVAGETLEQAIAVAKEANAKGATVSLDHLGEHVTDRGQAEAARDDYLACLDAIGEHGLDGNISVKLSQLGMGLDDDLAAVSLDQLAERAAAVGTTVSVDMEESDVTSLTIDIYSAAQKRHGNLGLAVQAYLHRTKQDLDVIMPLGGHVRLCKGAYAEPADIAYQSRDEVNTAFDQLTHLLMGDDGVKPAIASHDTDRLDVAASLVANRSGPYEYQMLYGVRTGLQETMLAAGDPLRIYVPYGVAWYPYLTRRMAERPANISFFMRAALSRS